MLSAFRRSCLVCCYIPFCIIGWLVGLWLVGRSSLFHKLLCKFSVFELGLLLRNTWYYLVPLNRLHGSSLGLNFLIIHFFCLICFNDSSIPLVLVSDDLFNSGWNQSISLTPSSPNIKNFLD